MEVRDPQRGKISGETKRLQVDGSDCRRREAILGGGEQSQVKCRRRGAVAGGGERSEVDGSDRRRREAIAVEGEVSQVEQVEERERRWRGAITGEGV